MFRKILIANRGEIAVRIQRACHEMGIETVAVHSTADSHAMHVRLANESVCIGPARSEDSYLNIPSLISACEISGADAVHPGYGFLSENPDFAAILAEHNIVFIGPNAEHLRLMGDKISAVKTMNRLGLPSIPGCHKDLGDIENFKKAAAEIGYPTLVKAAAGGGGRGVKKVFKAEDMQHAVEAARAETRSAFGNDTLYLEKYLQRPRHIEFQILTDGQGGAVHLGERECSLQRRFQKIWEEAPSVAVTAADRERIGSLCADAFRQLGYAGAATVEFLCEDGEFHFMEVNARLQVEHPTTEMVTGIDIVKEQIRIAAGEPLSFRQEDITHRGIAVECRINAENAETFAPSPGTVSNLHVPGGPGVRIDSGLYNGYRVPVHYDSMIGKLIVHGDDRDACLARLRRCLEEFVIEGVETTLPLFHRLARDPAVIKADFDIHWLETFLETAQGGD